MGCACTRFGRRRRGDRGVPQATLQLALEQLAGANDRAQRRAVGREQLNVGERIAVDHQQVGERARSAQEIDESRPSA